MRATRGADARVASRGPARAPSRALDARVAARRVRVGADRRRATARTRAPRALAEDGTARASVDAWLELYARDAPAGVFATFDARGTCTGVDHATNVASETREKWRYFLGSSLTSAEKHTETISFSNKGKLYLFLPRLLAIG